MCVCTLSMCDGAGLDVEMPIDWVYVCISYMHGNIYVSTTCIYFFVYIYVSTILCIQYARLLFAPGTCCLSAVLYACGFSLRSCDCASSVRLYIRLMYCLLCVCIIRLAAMLHALQFCAARDVFRRPWRNPGLALAWPWPGLSWPDLATTLT
jgi:hypothetical protein